MKMEVSKKVLQIFKDNLDSLDREDYLSFITEASKEADNMMQRDWDELFYVLESVLGLPEDDLQNLAIKLCCNIFMDRVDYERKLAASDPFEKKINSWSRYWYVREAVSFPSRVDNFLEILLRDDIQANMGLNMRPLPAEYGWEGDGDYDLGWFNEKEFDKFYGDQD